MKAAIITIGDEILLGQILDTNSQFIARELTNLGAETIEMRSVGDSRAEILNALENTLKTADTVIITGGLGPTKDDITKNALAEFFHTTLEFNPQVYKWLEELFAANPGRLNAYNKTQALLPKACVPLRNIKGTACGMWFEQDGKIVVSLPGVPFETEYLLPAEVLPRLKEKFTDLQLSYQIFTVYGIPEAELAMHLAAFEQTLPVDIKLAYLPSPGFVRLRLTAKGPAVEKLPVWTERLQQALNGLSFTQGEQPPEEIYARHLKLLGKSIACAESCTGGNIAHLITSVPGASAYFLGGIVAYANEVKINVLGVRAEDLQKYGAVSEAVAVQMAQGVRRITGADYAVSTTGVAGPDGGTPEKPVGTVWIAVAGPNGAEAKRFLFSRTRERTIGKASVTALEMLLKAVQNKRS
ncbi:MAG: competence/damage-inducible protein A [Elusimicrobiaceae bacterium]|nr:competence/damage-inducible protein A [Elusimicrobiaceae bacterium]